jgi:Pyridine nucleotide-disulphide oxidoreductase
MRADIDIAVVGSGPHGLSASVHLRRAGLEPQAFGPPMAFWRGMPRGMKLRSNLPATSIAETVGPLSLHAYARETGEELVQHMALERFLAYGDWVQRGGVPDVDVRTVSRLAKGRNGFVLELSDGESVTARRVVVACGIAPFAYVPPGFSHLPPGRISHTSEHRDMAAFAGRRVAVVGGGQSAFECAALMKERGAQVEVLVRGSDIVWLRRKSPKNTLGPLGPVVYAPTDVGPLWYSRLVSVPDLFRRLPRRAQTRIAARSIRPACSHFVRIRLDGVEVTLGATVRAATETGSELRLELSDGSVREVDHLLFGTGYRIDVARYPFLGPDILRDLRRVHGYPILGRGLESSVPGLHVVGAPAAWSFGPTMRFVSGSWYAGRSVAQAIGSRRAPA